MTKLIKFSSITLINLSISFFSIGQNAISIERDGIVKEITLLNEQVVHIRSYPSGHPQKPSLVVDNDNFKYEKFSTLYEKDDIIVETPILKIKYDYSSGNISFFDNKLNKLILNEAGSSFTPYEVLGDQAFNISQSFTISDTEALYGLGQFQEGVFNYRNNKALLVHANREIANPVLLSTKNYLLYWDNYSKTTFSDDDKGMRLWSEIGDGIDYYFIYGESMNEAMAGFGELTGHAPLPPKSSFGFWMSKERYHSFKELTEVVAEYRKRKIPLDNIIQDWQYWGKEMDLWNSMEFDTIHFNNPEEVISNLHNKYNVKLALSVWPAVGKKTRIHDEMKEADALFDVPTWAGYKVIDIYNPKAREIYWDYLHRGLYSQGVDTWWIDATEPSFKDGLYQSKQEEWTKKAGMTYIGTFARYLNTYSLFFSEMMYNNLRKTSNKRVSILTRSAFAGQQKYGTATWSGDIYASWNVLRKQVTAGLNLCMTGIPYWTTDIGAFRVTSSDIAGDAGTGEISNHIDDNVTSEPDGGYKKGLEDPAYLELYTRWFQFGTFNPIFRAHGTEVPREIWQFGEPGTPYYDAQLKMINLRYSLLSYIYSTAWRVTSKGDIMMKPLVMNFQNDTTTYNNGRSYMFGDALLVHPVTHPMYFDRNGPIKEKQTNIPIYLPEHDGIFWFDIYTGRTYHAGKYIDYDAPLDVIPVLVKGGTILPRNNVVEHISESDDREMSIDIYPGKDSSFELYEDDNETYNYEKGDYSIIRFYWDDLKQELTISGKEGNYNKHDSRVFKLNLYSQNFSNEDILPAKQRKIDYSNEAIKIKFQ